MVRYQRCSVPYCGHKRTKELNCIYSTFPKDIERCRSWVKRVGVEDFVLLPMAKLSTIRHVCGCHFEKNEFNATGTRLKVTAMPTILDSRIVPLSDEMLENFPLPLEYEPSSTGASSVGVPSGPKDNSNAVPKFVLLQVAPGGEASGSQENAGNVSKLIFPSVTPSDEVTGSTDTVAAFPNPILPSVAPVNEVNGSEVNPATVPKSILSCVEPVNEVNGSDDNAAAVPKFILLSVPTVSGVSGSNGNAGAVPKFILPRVPPVSEPRVPPVSEASDPITTNSASEVIPGVAKSNSNKAKRIRPSVAKLRLTVKKQAEMYGIAGDKPTPRELKLWKIIRTQTHELAKKDEELQSCADALKTLSSGEEYNPDLETISSPVLRQIVMTNIRDKNKDPRGRRWSIEDISTAASIYKRGPKAYEYLQSLITLPSVRTLWRVSRDVDVKKGMNRNIMKSLSNLVKKPQSVKKR